MSKIKNGGLDQHGAKPFELQQFETAGVEGVNIAGLLATLGVVFGESLPTLACLSSMRYSSFQRARREQKRQIVRADRPQIMRWL